MASFGSDMKKAVELSSKLEQNMVRLQKLSESTGKKNNFYSSLAQDLGDAYQNALALDDSIKNIAEKKLSPRLLQEAQELAEITNRSIEKINENSEKRVAIEQKIAKVQKDIYKAERIHENSKREKNKVGVDRAERMANTQKEKMRLLEEELKHNEALIKGEKEKLALEEEKIKRKRKEQRALEKEQRILEDVMRGTFLDPEIFGKESDVDKKFEYVKDKFEELGSELSGILSGSFDTVFSTLNERLGKTGKGLRALASKRESAGKTGGLTSKLGGAGKFLGRANLILGVGKALYDAASAIEEAQKSINKELVTTYGATDLMVSGYGDAYEAVNKLRKELADSDFATELGVSLDEARNMVYELNNMGINVRTVNGDLEAMKELTIGLKAISLGVGASFSDAASFAQNFREEMGVSVQNGHLLQRMGDEFARIRDMAAQSSFSTNRFFQVVQGLTENIGSMNVRVGEAGTLFMKLSKVLGPKAGQQFAQGLTEGFRSEGIQDRMKRIILTGRGKVKKALSRSGRSTYKEMIKDPELKSMLEDNKINSAADLGKLSDIKLQKIMADLRTKYGDAGGAKASQLLRGRDLARGGQGGMSNMVYGMGEFDMSGTLSAQMAQIMSFLGPKGFAGASAIQLEALSNYTGKSLDELMTYRKLDFSLQADWRRAQDVMTATHLSKVEKQAELAKLGLELNKDGKLVSKATGELVKDIQDFTHTQGDVLEDNKTTQLDQIGMLQEVRDATMTASERLGNKLGVLMQNMISPLNWIADHTGDKKDRQERQKKKEIAQSLKDEVTREREKIQEDREKGRKELARLEKEGAKAGVINKRRKEIEDALSRREATLGLKEEQARMLTSFKGSKFKGSAEEIKRQAEDEVLKQKSRSKSGMKLIAEVKDSQTALAAALADVTNTDISGSKAHMAGTAMTLTEEQANRLKSRGVKVGNVIRGQTRHTHEKHAGANQVHVDSTDLSRTLALEGGGAVRLSATERKTRQKGLFRFSDDIKTETMRDKRVTDVEKENETANKRLSEIAESLDAQKLSAPEQTKLATEQAQINARMTARNKEYQDATGKTFEEAILSAKKKELESTVKSYMSNANFDGMDRRSALGYIKALGDKVDKTGGPTQDQFNLIRDQFRQYYAYDSKMGPNDPTPYLFRRGTVTIGQPSDTAYFRDETVANNSGGGRGMPSVVNIYVNGGEQNKVFETVKNAVSAANKMAMA